MKNEKANELAEQILEKSNKKFDSEWIIKSLKSLRELAKEEGDPAVVKIIRYAYEHIEENDDFEIGYADPEEDGMTDFEFFMNIIIRSEKDKSKEDLAAMKDKLYSLK